MPCGIKIITGIPDSDIGGTEAAALLDQPKSTSKQQAADGSWTLTLVFDPCQDSDPIVQGGVNDPAPRVIGSAATTPTAFIQAHLADAQAVKQQYRVPIACTLAQSGLETGWGRSVVGNAYFGIKATSPGQSSVTTSTHEFVNGAPVSTTAAFASYANFTEAAMGYGAFLTTNQRYAGAFQHTDNPEAFALAVAAAGFATSPTYGQDLVQIMTDNNLEQYDRV